MIALMKKVRIAILDSGVCKDHSAFKNKTICGFSLCVENGKVNYYDDFSDDIGHGTAVFYLIERKLKDVCITNIKIYDSLCGIYCPSALYKIARLYLFELRI